MTETRSLRDILKSLAGELPPLAARLAVILQNPARDHQRCLSALVNQHMAQGAPTGAVIEALMEIDARLHALGVKRPLAAPLVPLVAALMLHARESRLRDAFQKERAEDATIAFIDKQTLMAAPPVVSPEHFSRFADRLLAVVHQKRVRRCRLYLSDAMTTAPALSTLLSELIADLEAQKIHVAIAAPEAPLPE